MSKQITLTLPPEFLKLCESDHVDPEAVLKGFIGDLAAIQNWLHPNPAEGRMPRENDGYSSNGSDERMMARAYYERVGWPDRGSDCEDSECDRCNPITDDDVICSECGEHAEKREHTGTDCCGGSGAWHE